jgi:hypothetical protein
VYGSNGIDQVGADHRLQHITHSTHLQGSQRLNVFSKLLLNEGTHDRYLETL